MRRVEVAVRERPVAGADTCMTFDMGNRVVRVCDDAGVHAAACPRYFSSDLLFDRHATNREIFEQLLLQRMAEATPARPDTLCLLAYGHTSSGKTHTIAGSEGEPGLLTLCVEELLRREGVVEVAMLEVYMESVNDLLAEGAPRRLRRQPPADPSKGAAPVVVVENLTTCTLTTVEQWLAVSEFGMRSRRTAPTERNVRSSRSHALFTIKSNGVRVCLVDLAGSERQSVFSPQLNKESISINKSLSRLSTVLEALSTQRVREDGTRSFVNFRDTTLTILLQRYLTGASRTTFLACVHPELAFYGETLSTLRYTQRLKKITTRVSRPGADDVSVVHPAQHQELLEELTALRQRLRTAESRSQEVERAQRRRIEELETSLQQQQQHETGGGDTHRARDTKRVAGWLLSRILGDLPQLNVGYDDYFDCLLPPQVLVVGYVSTMACLPPRDPRALAFLDVGDFAMGLSMVDAGIPPQVPLHAPGCADVACWEGYEFDQSGELVYALAFFDVSFLGGGGGGGERQLECCGGLVAAEPLLPIATVLCARADASVALKEGVLQRLVSLQGQQDEAFELRGGEADPGDSDDPRAASPASSSSGTLARELQRQAQNPAALLAPPFDDAADTGDASFEEELRPPPARREETTPAAVSVGDVRLGVRAPSPTAAPATPPPLPDHSAAVPEPVAATAAGAATSPPPTAAPAPATAPTAAAAAPASRTQQRRRTSQADKLSDNTPVMREKTGKKHDAVKFQACQGCICV